MFSVLVRRHLCHFRSLTLWSGSRCPPVITLLKRLLHKYHADSKNVWPDASGQKSLGSCSSSVSSPRKRLLALLLARPSRKGRLSSPIPPFSENIFFFITTRQNWTEFRRILFQIHFRLRCMSSVSVYRRIDSRYSLIRGSLLLLRFYFCTHSRCGIFCAVVPTSCIHGLHVYARYQKPVLSGMDARYVNN